MMHFIILSFALSLQDLGPEFFRMLDEPQVVLELPGSIVVRKNPARSLVLASMPIKLLFSVLCTTF